MLSELQSSILDLDLDVLLTFIIGLAVIFFGISENIRDKIFRLKNIIILYIGLFIIIVFFDNVISVFLFMLVGILAGAIIFLHDKENKIELELKLRHLLTYYSFAWIFLNKTYIWIICCLLLIIIDLPFTKFVYSNSLYEINLEYIKITIILFCLAYQYIKVSISFFDFYNFDKAIEHLYINLEKNSSIDESDENKIIYNKIDNNIELLSFVLYMEDKNMFKRNKPYPTLYTDFILSKSKLERMKFFPGIQFNNKYNGIKKFKRFLRGFSTIEQQFLRQRVMKENSYRYKIRRKLFIEYIYTAFFVKAICTRKSMTFSRSKRKNKKYAKYLRKNLKYHFLVSYYVKVLGNPVSEEELLKNMANNSRVSRELYIKIYDVYKDSSLKKTYITYIKDARDSNFKFNIKNAKKSD